MNRYIFLTLGIGHLLMFGQLAASNQFESKRNNKGFDKTGVEDMLNTFDPKRTDYGNGEACVNGFRCPYDGTCILMEQRCNDVIGECPMNQDQLECDACIGDAFHCASDRQCIPRRWRCDYDSDCPSGEDEINCECDFKCEADNKCIRMESVCDGYRSCSDGQDEKDCECEYKCEADDVCISKELVCDGMPSCSDEQDEKDCDTCSENAFYCVADKKCLAAEWRCDHEKDCPSGEDEAECPCEFTCKADDKCIRKELVCDGYPTCSDGQDEIDCDSCDGDAFHCTKDKKCLPAPSFQYRCDSYKHCKSGEDEVGCPCDLTCKHYNEPVCVGKKYLCDGYKHCDDGQDETNCESCVKYAYHCVKDKQCTNLWSRCNYDKDCPSGGDEEECPCDFKCKINNYTCIAKKKKVPTATLR